MRRFIRPKLTVLTVWVMLMAVAMPLVLSSVHTQPIHAAAPATVIVPSMKLPWDKSITPIPLRGGPFGHVSDTGCNVENTSIMSGVDFGLPQNTNVLAVAAGKVIYAGYTDNQIRNEVRIDHGGGFVTEYWGLNAIDPAIVVGGTVAQGQVLGLSGYTPCPTCKNGISVHLRLEFRQYSSNPLSTTPLSAHGMSIDGYRIWTFLNPSTGKGYAFQGTMTRGKTISEFQSECGTTGVKTWYSQTGPTILANPKGTGGYLTSTNTQQVLTDWPMFGFDAQGTRFNPYETVLNPANVSSLVLDWKYNTGGEPQAVVVNGIVYANTFYGNFVYALNATTGAYLWSYPISIGQSSLAVANGVVYIGSTDNKLYALNATTGAYLWSYTTGSGIDSAPSEANGVVYIGSTDNKLYALNATTGAYLWSYTTGSGIDSAPSEANGVVYVGSEDHALYALNATTGAYLWSYLTKRVILTSPAVANGVVYIGSYNDKLYALNATTGKLLWSYTIYDVVSSPAVANGVVYIGSADGDLYAFNATTGVNLWVWSDLTGYSIDSSPAVSNGVVYVGSGDNYLFAFHLPGTTS